ncbi:MAG: hypothetical protein Q8K32_00650 [Archangium sp.]|nr:hypothetical protein [Archangium sp.]
MSQTRNLTFSLISLFAFGALPAFAQSAEEKAKDTVNDGSRKVKKSAHRAGEALCTGTKAECAKKKAENRGEEAKDAAKDKAEELKDKAD